MKYTYLIIALSFFMFSCQREELDLNVQNEIETGDPMVKVEGRVAGFITDGQGEPVENAVVTLGNITSTTNEFGAFTIIDQELYADGTYLTVEKSGFFPGSRRFNAIEDATNNVRIRLIEKIEVGNYSTDMGGEVEASTAKITLPAGSYSMDDGSSYSGNVKVYAKYLDPTKSETFEEMPGDLVGTDSEGELNALATFGMVAVELENDNGQKVNLPEGETAMIRMAVPEELLSVAPSTIPLWHFDEERGMWLEEGEANLENGIYVGEVSHFSFWNCDYPFPLVTINGSISLNGSLSEGIKLQIKDLTTGFHTCGYTSSRGIFGGKVPAGTILRLRVLDPCGGVLFEMEIGPFDVDTDLGLIDITSALETAHLTGIVTNCTGEPINESAVVFNFGLTDMLVICEDDGSFDFATPPCLNGEVDVYGLDLTNSLISPEASINFSGSQSVGTLIACDDYIEEQFIIEYDNINWGETAMDSTLLGYNVEVDSFINTNATQVRLTFTVIDWNVFDPNDDRRQYVGEYIYNIGDDSAQLNGQFQSQGFAINGTSSYDEINQAGDKYLRFNFSTSDVVITDPSLFPGDVGEVKVFLTIPIQ